MKKKEYNFFKEYEKVLGIIDNNFRHLKNLISDLSDRIIDSNYVMRNNTERITELESEIKKLKEKERLQIWG